MRVTRPPLVVRLSALVLLIAATAVASVPASSAPASVAPVRPSALALGHGGVLYVADDARHQILAMTPSGRFHVVAGTGTAGYSGDGGPAVRARLTHPAGMAVLGDGGLVFADDSDNRVRVVLPDGRIKTLAGDGRFGWVQSGTRARQAHLGSPAAVAVGPDGLLYIALSGANEIVRLDHDGSLARIAGSSRYGGIDGIGGPALAASPSGPNGLAFDGQGDMYIAGFNAKALLMIDRKGLMRLPGGNRRGFYPRGDGGVASGPSGRVFAIDTQRVVTLNPEGEHPVADFARLRGDSMRTFLPDGIAVGRDGSIYVDTFRGNGWASRSLIAVIRPDRSIRVLWRGP
jgi:sugar lactone lactonase YvrE